MSRLHCTYIYRVFGFPLYGGSNIPQLVLMYLCLSYVLFNPNLWKKGYFALHAKSKEERSISQREETVKGKWEEARCV